MNAARDCFVTCSEGGSKDNWRDALEAHKERFERAYQDAKAALLKAAAAHELSIEDVDRLLDSISGARRMVEQLIKATIMLNRELDGMGMDDGQNGRDNPTQRSPNHENTPDRSAIATAPALPAHV